MGQQEQLGASLTNQVVGFQGRQAWVGEAEDLVVIHDAGLNMNQQADLSPKGKDTSSSGGSLGLVPSLPSCPAPDSAAELVSHPVAFGPSLTALAAISQASCYFFLHSNGMACLYLYPLQRSFQHRPSYS